MLVVVGKLISIHWPAFAVGGKVGMKWVERKTGFHEYLVPSACQEFCINVRSSQGAERYNNCSITIIFIDAGSRTVNGDLNKKIYSQI